MARKNGLDALIISYPGSQFFADSAAGLASMLKAAGLKASSATLEGDWRGCVSRLRLAANPRLVVAINMCRSTLGDCLDGVPVASWRQDDCSELDGPARAQRWNAANKGRDWVFGYTQGLEAWGYPRERLIETPLFIDPAGMAATPSKGPVLLMATNKGGSPMPMMRSAGLDKLPLKELGERLSAHYKSGRKLPSFTWLRDYCTDDPATNAVALAMDRSPPAATLLYWHFAERIYRRTLAGWMVDATPDWVLVGEGWPKNPDAPYRTPGALPRGDLPAWRASSAWCLHANSHVGPHHNIVEILLAGGRPLAHSGVGAELGVEYQAQPFDRADYAARQAFVMERAFERMLGNKPDGWPGDALHGYMGCVSWYRDEAELKRYAGDASPLARAIVQDVVDGTKGAA